MFTPEDLKVSKTLKLEKLIERIVNLTDYILNHSFWVFKGSCLKRSLVLYYILRKYGIDIQICMGVKYNGELSDNEVEERKLDGHAWLVYNGDIFKERNPEVTRTYKMTYCFPEGKNRRKMLNACPHENLFLTGSGMGNKAVE